MKDKKLKDDEIFIVLDKNLRVIDRSEEFKPEYLKLKDTKSYIVKIMNKKDITDIITFDMIRNKTRDI